MDKKILENICNKIAKSNFFKKYAYKDYWLSGCTTDVAPITANAVNNYIEIQLNCNTLRGIKKSLDKLVMEINNKLVKNYYICKYDGSCPNVAKIYFK